MKHTQACLDRQSDLAIAQSAFNNQYPNHCQACGAKGGVDFYETTNSA